MKKRTLSRRQFLDFLGPAQAACLNTGCRGEERQTFLDIYEKFAEIIDSMPRTYDTDGETGRKVYLHYFCAGADAWIIELDAGTEEDTAADAQSQMFGLIKFCHLLDGELGYLSLQEFKCNGWELDFYFEPEPLADVLKQIEQRQCQRSTETERQRLKSHEKETN